MERTVARTLVVAGPLGEAEIARLRFPDVSASQYHGDPIRIRAMLRSIAATPGGRVTVATDGGVIVGFVALVPPVHGDRFSAAPSALELAVAEIHPQYRGQRLFTRLFEAAFSEDLEDHIVYVVADPALRSGGETPRGYRDRMLRILGGLGFFPYPTTYPGAVLHPDAELFVRTGRAVPTYELEEFLERLREVEGTVHVGIVLPDPAFRNLIRTDLERNGMTVVAVCAQGEPPGGAEVVVTDATGPAGGLLTVRLADLDEERFSGNVIWLPFTEVERLPSVVRREIARRRNTRWLKSSSSGS